MNFLRRLIASPSSRSQVSEFAKRSFKTSTNHTGSIVESASTSLVHGIHQFHCPDVVGILARLSDCIASKEGNILNADIFVPDNNDVFYSRSEFLFDPAKWPREQMDADFSKIAKNFNAMKSIVRVPDIDPKYKIAVLASKQDHCLVDLLHGWQDGRLPIDITSVISGFMQVLSGDFLKSYNKDIINIHHGLLPSFKGSNPSKQAFDAGVKLIGATTHFVSEELDSGPIIEQLVERVSHRDNLRTFIQKSEDVEKRCLAKAIKSYCELRIFPHEANKTVVFRS
ncbi:formyltetrahydrofolate deformylase 2, mitochondrial isoform X2 [Capsicum annuum]|uniref:formyltetrahydrofolate deformylase 2, mitochondrial isoform X2 n=1 Tax=Capsicum annuum TaxID=4072 RepID=UPI001FB11037|nr:formyltetrahydrofolate deformylase 2, mitochondrial isoform X2 [Capsicum annuum]